jgi:cytochrome c oxidase subunit 4
VATKAEEVEAVDEEIALATDHGSHPTERTYWKIFVFLFVITAVEVVLYYKNLPGVNFNNAVLGLLALVKFATVVGYFMHLKFDNRILRRLFITGLVLATVVYCIYLSTLGTFSRGGK